MSDKTAPQKEVEVTKKEETKAKDESVPIAIEDESKSENGDSTENSETTEPENSKDEPEEKKDEVEKKDEPEETDKCCIKRKSTGGDVTDATTPAEGATPEKKAKLDESAERASNGKSEVAA